MKIITTLAILATLGSVDAASASRASLAPLSSPIQREGVELLRGGLTGRDLAHMQRTLNDAMTADCESTGGRVLGFATHSTRRSDGEFEVNAELTCGTT
ncbi:hypothetical protein [Luteibacter aegosomatissinici]|uniref:hypothetical protein n=1 Tax=Luteibacter aegosomatissinici TaxID=2911539 RepID=UPI001FF903F8|nr:hypothetical protein [Luteibacter aegosomatissinici]UPG93977.1 hypothetical protein L2Y97_19450 [Luteibacter aegosomatissinici]